MKPIPARDHDCLTPALPVPLVVASIPYSCRDPARGAVENIADGSAWLRLGVYSIDWRLISAEKCPLEFKNEPAKANRYCKNRLTEVRKDGWRRSPDDIDHRAHVGAGSIGVGLPIWYHFVQIQNRLVVAETNLIEQGNVASKLFPYEDLVVSPHCHNEVCGLDQLLGKLPLGTVASAPFSRK